MYGGATDFSVRLARAQDGDVDSVHELYREYAPVVRGYLRGHGAADPDDITSEVFVDVLRNLATFTGSEESFRTWVFVITHRRLLDERRRIGRRRTDCFEPDRLLALVAATDHDAGDRALDRLGTERAMRLLDDLTPTQRSVVLLHTIGGLPLRQVATILDKQVGAVKALHRRALRSVARAIEREELGIGDDR
jgi:RNA polymerase sigma-70 factor (ECF subfamily)